MVAPGTAAWAAAVALVRSSPVSGVSVIPLATWGPWGALASELPLAVAAAVDELESVCADAVPSTDAPKAPPMTAAPTSAVLSRAFCPIFMILLALGGATTGVATARGSDPREKTRPDPSKDPARIS